MSTHVSDVAGLTSSEAARRLSVYGENRMPEGRSQGIPGRVIGQLRDPMIVLLLAAAGVTIAVGDFVDTSVIGIVVALNTAIGVVQEVRSARAIDALAELSAPRATVLRDGALEDVEARLLVPGDLVELDAGDIVPADGVVTEQHRLQLDESAMTGESLPVDRPVGDSLSSGTVVTLGRARMMVTSTGSASALGRIAELIASTPVEPTPLQQRLTRLSRLLVGVVLAVTVVVLAIGLMQGRPFVEMLVVAVSLAVAAVPESLPAVVSVALALGARRMAQRSAIIRRLPAVETLGSVTVLASDKTGTLTQNRMVVERLWTPRQQFRATGDGYSPLGEITPVPPDAERDDAGLAELLRDGVLCNDAELRLDPSSEAWSSLGDPLEAALLAVANRGGQDPARLRSLWLRVAEVPFDSHRRFMTTLHRYGDRWLQTTKGAPETVLLMVEATPQVVAAARSAAHRLATAGYRVLALAHAEGTGAPPAELDRRLSLAGLVAIADPPRPDAMRVIRRCRDAGIRPVLITGDHAGTAAAVAARLGISDGFPGVLDGAAVARGELPELETVGTFARTHPEQKVTIVDAFRRQGHVVAMTGDGVNDAPALRRADIGVAMGKGGTEVARQAADLVLADDDLGSVIAAVEEGRRIYANIRAFLGYAVSGGVAEVLVMLVGPFAGLGLPLLPAQILWINMLTHGLPGVAFGSEPLDPRAMARPSPSPRRAVLGGGLVAQIGAIGSMIAIVALAAGLWAPTDGQPVQTSIFVTLGMAQLGVAVALRARGERRRLSQRGVEIAVGIAAAFQVSGVYVPWVQDLLGTEAVAPVQLLWLLLLAALPGSVVGLSRRFGVRPSAKPDAASAATRPAA